MVCTSPLPLPPHRTKLLNTLGSRCPDAPVEVEELVMVHRPCCTGVVQALCGYLSLFFLLYCVHHTPYLHTLTNHHIPNPCHPMRAHHT
jgi:hypothetical protein